MEELHVFHHSSSDAVPRVSLEVERNSRSLNYKIAVQGASSVDEAIQMLQDGLNKLRITLAEAEL